ncbi:TlpA family protein disulfide reductase [Fontivita pretiosa]|uniref:TlpA family protein disulfide reductase n=1 Tax=Fontivita pretiosa TaxID=2989684 RepID=UPI003D18072D
MPARWHAQLGLLAAAGVFVVAFSIVLAGSLERPNDRVGRPGTVAPGFRLPDLDGRFVSLSSMQGKVVVVCFAPPPGQDHSAEAEDAPDARRLGELAKRYTSSGAVKLVSVYSNIDHQDREQVRGVRQRSAVAGSDCITLLDPIGMIARRYAIDSTPTFVLIDSAGVIRYRGGIDDASPDAPLAATSFTNMIDLLLAERPLSSSRATSPPAVLSKIR